MHRHYFEFRRHCDPRLNEREDLDGERCGRHERCHRGRGGREGMHGFGGRHRGFGGGRERLFDSGDFKLVLLKLIAEEPSYGYQLIKTLEERLAGGYTPSAGAIYPTLTMLEEEGFISSSISESNKKVYSITKEGTAFLKENSERIEELFDRLKAAKQEYSRSRSPEIMKAFMALRESVVSKMARGTVTKEQIRKIAEQIEAAAKAIEEL